MKNINDEKFYTPIEVAEKIGYTRKTIYRWIKKGNIEFIKLKTNGRIYISANSLIKIGITF